MELLGYDVSYRDGKWRSKSVAVETAVTVAAAGVVVSPSSGCYSLSLCSKVMEVLGGKVVKYTGRASDTKDGAVN